MMATLLWIHENGSISVEVNCKKKSFVLQLELMGNLSLFNENDCF